MRKKVIFSILVILLCMAAGFTVLSGYLFDSSLQEAPAVTGTPYPMNTSNPSDGRPRSR